MTGQFAERMPEFSELTEQAEDLQTRLRATMAQLDKNRWIRRRLLEYLRDSAAAAAMTVAASRQRRSRARPHE